jgi:hypothetical protein
MKLAFPAGDPLDDHPGLIVYEYTQLTSPELDGFCFEVNG